MSNIGMASETYICLKTLQIRRKTLGLKLSAVRNVFLIGLHHNEAQDIFQTETTFLEFIKYA